ncbi:MAG: NADPH-dependent oxidoreductase [Bacteroidetes bacterium GWF2_38_335]|nr:MAG: NADPH-dependent oxidoreductase [Bacteroidetes bacterium GWF2_38_335]OFY76887.1 MAG: NADPH-dependent oxidoreductase [Bacteroidetes bacterium RIFOXYA12_FULL_38_20]HBS86735.1 NADPH-dependent oxidoreductase [Bacteroidales bacterium]
METILKHRSIRKYKSDKIEDAVLRNVLEAGIRASNTGNMQVYSIVVTTEQELKNRLWEFHFKQEMVRQAPVVLTFCADINRFNKWCDARNAEPAYDNFLWLYTATIDAVIAAQNVCIAAEKHGLGICYLGTTNYNAPQIIELLNLPKGVLPVTTVVMGYPDETPGLTDRLPAEAVVHFEKYNDFDKNKIDALYLEKESLEETKKLIAENKTENLAQIFTSKRYTRINNIHFSKVLMETIEKQGFMNNE